MVLHFVLLASLTLAAAIAGTFGRLPQNDKIYVIQNAHHGTYLEALTNRIICERRSDVITSATFNQDSEAFRWKTSIYSDGKVIFEINGFSSELTTNEFTMEDEDTPPYCFLKFAEYEVISGMGNTFMIKNIRAQKCLKANRVGQRISWDQCQQGQNNQFWTFIELGARANRSAPSSST